MRGWSLGTHLWGEAGDLGGILGSTGLSLLLLTLHCCPPGAVAAPLDFALCLPAICAISSLFSGTELAAHATLLLVVLAGSSLSFLHSKNMY